MLDLQLMLFIGDQAEKLMSDVASSLWLGGVMSSKDTIPVFVFLPTVLHT